MTELEEFAHDLTVEDAAKGFIHQGLVCPLIYLAEHARDSTDSYAPVQAVIDFVNWALNEAALLPGEFPTESLFSYYVDYYLAQVNNGGHGQYAHNSNWGRTPVRAAQLGLRAMGAVEHAAILDEFVALMNGPDRERAAAIKAASGFGDPDPLEKELNQRFFALDGTDGLIAKNAAWVRSLPNVRWMAPTPLEDALSKALLANVERSSRLDWSRNRNEEIQAADPLYRTVKALCRTMRLEFLGLTAGSFLPMNMVAPSLPAERVFCWGVQTNRGIGYVFFRNKRGWFRKARAELYERGNPEPIAYLDLSQDDFNAIAPN